MPVPQYYETKTFEHIGEFHVSCNLVREKYSIHQHEYYELELIIEGEGKHVVNGETGTLKTGDVVFVTPMDRHGYESCLIRTITVHFSGMYLSPMFKNALSQSKNRIISDVGSTVRRYFEETHKVFMGDGGYKEVKLKNLVELILLELMPDSFADANSSFGVADRLSEAIGYINVNFTKEITLSSIESQFGLTSSYFSHAFKKRTGKTFVSYIAEKRVDYAKKLLLSGERVIDTCYECGFSSERNFTRRFKELTGVSPKEYKNSAKNGI